MHINLGGDFREQWESGGGADVGRAKRYEGDDLDLQPLPSVTFSAPERDKPASTFLIVLREFARVLVPAGTLASFLVAILVLFDRNVTEFNDFVARPELLRAPADWMSWGLLMVPLSFFAIQLTGRRYGPGTSLVQIALAWVLAGCAIAVLADHSGDGPAALPVMSVRVAVSLGIALVASQIIAALMFDGMRCVRWWQAPLASGIWASLIFVVLFYPTAFIGGGQPWLGYMAVHFALLIVETLLLLVPYWAFRPLIRPLPGYAGY